MSKVSKSRVKVVTRQDAAAITGFGLPDQMQVDLAQVAAVAREGLLAVSVKAGLQVAAAMIASELETICGAKHAKLPLRNVSRYGSAPSSVVMGGRRIPLARPRARTRDGQEVQLDTFQTFADDDLLSNLVVERMLAGVATRRHAVVNEPVGAAIQAQARSTSKSAVSRRFVSSTSRLVDELLSRDLSQLQVAVLMIDGIIFAEACCVVALAITTDGTKIPVGLWLGDTENKTVVTALLADLVDRGLGFEDGLLVVIDGSKALAAGVKKVFGPHALIQRCALHKRRNVAGHLPRDTAGWVDRKLAAAFARSDPDAGLRAARQLAGQLEKRWPDAAASLREGLEEMFTVRRLGVSARLALTLTSTNPCESMIGIARDTTRRVKRWRDGTMIRRWCAAGLITAERSFRRVKGCKDMPTLVAALKQHVTRLTGADHAVA